MTPENTTNFDPRRSRLEEAIAAYERAADAGEAPTQDEWLRLHPDLAEELRSFLANRAAVRQAAGPLRDTQPPPRDPDATLAPAGAEPGRDGGTVAVEGYEILGMLGRGGMGIVYKARHLKLRRTVALKMILAGGHADEADLERFRTEAEALARLQHPNIVQVFEVGEQGGLPFFCLEYCPGGSLEKKLGGTPLPAQAAAALVEELARGMHAAHEKGVVHRDLKPANVLLAEDGAQMKITDFGLAKKLDEAGKTATGAVMGTPSYMAPEQAGGRSKEIGPACDVYALGAILYECLTGRPPFRAATPLDTIMQVVSAEPVAVREMQPGCPRDLETICHKCLQKDVGKRYASAAALAEDLRRFQNGEPITARPVGRLERGWRWCRRNPAVAGLAATVAAVLLLGAAVSTAFGLQARNEAARANQEASNAQEKEQQALAEKQTAETEWEQAKQAREAAKEEARKATEALAREADERELKQRQLMNLQLERVAAAYEKDPGQALALLYDVNACPIHLRDTAWRFYERACSRWELDVLQGHTEAVWSVAFSPDGLTLASGSLDNRVRLWDTKTGQSKATLLGHTSGVWSVAFSPDGLTLASASQDKMVRLWDVKTGQSKATLSGDTLPVTSVAFSPNGLTLASGSGGEVRLWDTKTAQTRATLSGGTHSMSLPSPSAPTA